MKTKNLENFQKLVSNENSGWLDKFLHYKANQKILDRSSKVAVNVLEALRERKMTQKDLAEKMNVSAQQINKIVRGQQNLTFGTIGKLEDALGINLIEIIEFKSINEIKTNAVVIKANKESQSDEILLEKFETNPFSNNFKKKKSTNMSVVYSKSKELMNYNKPTYNVAI